MVNDEGKVVQDAARRFRDDQQYAKYCAELLKRCTHKSCATRSPSPTRTRRVFRLGSRTTPGLGLLQRSV